MSVLLEQSTECLQSFACGAESYLWAETASPWREASSPACLWKQTMLVAQLPAGSLKGLGHGHLHKLESLFSCRDQSKHGFCCWAFQHSRLQKLFLLLRAKQKLPPTLHTCTSIATGCPDSTDLNSMECIPKEKWNPVSWVIPPAKLHCSPSSKCVQVLWVCVSFGEHVEGRFQYKQLHSYSPFGVEVQGDFGKESYSSYFNLDQTFSI